MGLYPTNKLAELSPDIDIVLAGQTGVGKSSLINMIMGIPDHAHAAAKVSNNANPCTPRTTTYPVLLGTGMRCQLWDTRGLDEAVDMHARSFVGKMVGHVRQLASQPARELKEILQDRIKIATPVLMWCIDATKIDTPFYWQQFQKAYVEYCNRNAMLVIVITRLSPKATGWETKCRNQLQQLDLGEETDVEGIPLLAVRKYQSVASPEYSQDSKALKDLISELKAR